MATVNTISFDQASYAPGETITATVDYTPDPAGTTQNFDFTANVVDASGNVVASSSAPFVVSTPGVQTETVSVSDTGGHVWAEGSPVDEADGSISVPFTATA